MDSNLPQSMDFEFNCPSTIAMSNTHDSLPEDSEVTNQAPKLDYSKPISDLYYHVCISDCCLPRWSDYDNVRDEQAEILAAYSDAPIIHRHKLAQTGIWVTDSIAVQDVTMRKVLAKILNNYQDLDLEMEEWTFRPPFMSLVHRWEQLKAFPSETEDEQTSSAAVALLESLSPILASSIASSVQTAKSGKIIFEKIWQLFAPGSLVITKFFDVDTICRVLKYRPDHDLCTLDMEYVDWNGDTAGYADIQIAIRRFDGQRRVTSLPVCPITFLGNIGQIEANMLERGRKFEQLRGYHFMVSGAARISLETKTLEQRPSSGKVCVDAYAYYRFHNLAPPNLRSLFGGKESELTTSPKKSPKRLAQDPDFKFAVTTPTGSSPAKGSAKRNEDLRPLTDEQCIMTTPWMKGFDMKSKEWCELRVDSLTGMVWNDEAFDKLVLPGGEKELIWDFVENKTLSNADFDDLIPDKGKGLLLLMFGPPGCGKTFTAEAVAERSRVPLYSMSAGDLGTQPADVERNLDRALELCRMWNAMLLLDEADVFMGARTNESLARNELVSIFLTKLEYYQGILFLTTNRISSIDHAFQSRIDLFLAYQNLAPEARRQVWENFIGRAGRDKFEVDDGSLDKLSRLELNGREIKNLIKSAQLLSWKSGTKIPMNRLYMLANKRQQALNFQSSSLH